jgi:HTH-type transcriptional regulator / antitoxin HigA
MSIFPVRSDEDHRRALDRIHVLMDAEEGAPEGAELEALATLVEAHERKKYPPCPPTPLEAIIFRMEQMGYTLCTCSAQDDLTAACYVREPL